MRMLRVQIRPQTNGMRDLSSVIPNSTLTISVFKQLFTLCHLSLNSILIMRIHYLISFQSIPRTFARNIAFILAKTKRWYNQIVKICRCNSWGKNYPAEGVTIFCVQFARKKNHANQKSPTLPSQKLDGGPLTKNSISHLLLLCGKPHKQPVFRLLKQWLCRKKTALKKSDKTNKFEGND